jgi:pyruvate carboxylase subunit B
MSTETFRALVGDRTYEIVLEDGQLYVDGEPKDHAFEILRTGYVSLIIGGKSVPVAVESTGEDTLQVTIAGRCTEVRVKDERALLLEEFGLDEALAGGGEVRAPMPGLVLDLFVKEGDDVEADQGLAVLEAMKMENELRAPARGTVTAIHAAPGDAVDKNQLLIEIEAD